jgi:hypothetical protein
MHFFSNFCPISAKKSIEKLYFVDWVVRQWQNVNIFATGSQQVYPDPYFNQGKYWHFRCQQCESLQSIYAQF